MANIFFVGASGHIGGAVLDLIASKYADSVSVKALLRDQEKADILTSRYKHLTHVIGNLDDLEILEAEARAADIVINAGPDVTHNAGIRALLKGLSRRTQSGKGYYIHTSGAALVWDKSDGSTASSKVWDDIEDIKTIMSMPKDSVHIDEDDAVREAAPDVNVAIVSPTFVYGPGPSPIHPLPLTMPDLVKPIRDISSGFTVSVGKNLVAWTHVMDCARIYLLLLSHALKEKEAVSSSDIQIWGPEAYYFAEQEEMTFRQFMEILVPVLQRLGELKSDEIKIIDSHAAAVSTGAAKGLPVPDSWALHIIRMFGANMRVRSSRARALGWKPEESGVGGTLEGVFSRYLEAEKSK